MIEIAEKKVARTIIKYGIASLSNINNGYYSFRFYNIIYFYVSFVLI